MRIQCAKLAVYNTRAVDLLQRWQEHRVPCGDVDAIAGPQPDSMAALLGHKAEAIPLGLEDPPFIVEGFLDECRERDSCLFFRPGLWISTISAGSGSPKLKPGPAASMYLGHTIVRWAHHSKG
jgi:hypothetical protein